MRTLQNNKRSVSVFFLALVFAATPLAAANATILFAGGEDSDFVNLNGASASTSAGTFSSSYARESIVVNSNNGCINTFVPPVNYFMTPTFTANSVIWVHAWIDPSYTGCNPITSDVLRVYSPDGYARIVVEEESGAQAGPYNIYSRNQAGTQTLLASMLTACFLQGHLLPLDLYINYASGGEVTLYCNGVQVADYVGNVTTNSATQLSQVQFSSPSTNGQATYWSEVIVSTTSTLSMRLATLTPSANGNATNWDTGGVSNINETTLNLTTVNASGTAGELQEYTIGTSTIPSGSYSVVGVVLNADAQVDTSGPQHLQGVVRTGGTDYTSSNMSPTQSAWGFISTSFLTNPATGNAWALSDLTNAGFNIGFESQN